MIERAERSASEPKVEKRMAATVASEYVGVGDATANVLLRIFHVDLEISFSDEIRTLASVALEL
jgi:hypothetical protein